MLNLDNTGLHLQETPPRTRVPLGAIALSLARITSTQVGGGAQLTIRRELVRHRRWFTESEYLEVLSLSQLCPGPQICNIAVLVGMRLRGSAGAVTAWAATTLPSLALLFVIAVILLRGSSIPAIADALKGCAAGAVGLTLANSLELTAPRRKSPRDLLFIAASATAGLFHVPLAVTLGVLIPLSALAVALERV